MHKQAVYTTIKWLSHSYSSVRQTIGGGGGGNNETGEGGGCENPTLLNPVSELSKATDHWSPLVLRLVRMSSGPWAYQLFSCWMAKGELLDEERLREETTSTRFLP